MRISSCCLPSRRGKLFTDSLKFNIHVSTWTRLFWRCVSLESYHFYTNIRSVHQASYKTLWIYERKDLEESEIMQALLSLTDPCCYPGWRRRQLPVVDAQFISVVNIMVRNIFSANVVHLSRPVLTFYSSISLSESETDDLHCGSISIHVYNVRSVYYRIVISFGWGANHLYRWKRTTFLQVSEQRELESMCTVSWVT